MKITNIIMINLKYIISFCIILVISFSVADELDDKMKQLRQIEKQIDLLQQKTNQIEKQKKKTQIDIDRSIKIKNETEKLVNVLQRKENIAQDSLHAINLRVLTTEEQLKNLKKLGVNECIRLYYIDLQDKYTAKETKEKYLLSLLISATVKRIKELLVHRDILISTQKQRKKEYFGIHNARLLEIKRKDILTSKITSLKQQENKLEKDKEEYEKTLAKLKKDAVELESLISKLTAQTEKKEQSYKFTGKKICWPVKGKIIRDFGEESTGLNTTVLSNGIDIAVPEGTNVLAVDDGEVIFSDRYGGQGKLIIIDHKNGFFSVYAYNKDLIVTKGTFVKKGQPIAKSGKSGTTNQPSLHFELRKDGRAVNPLNYLE